MTNNTTTTITPFLTVSNGKKAVEFYSAAFGAVETKRFEMPDEKLSSVIEIEDATFFVADEEPENGNVSPGITATTSVRIVLQTKNADLLFEKAVACGATQLCPITTEDNWRIGKLKDPFGHVWEIGYKL